MSGTDAQISSKSFEWCTTNKKTKISKKKKKNNPQSPIPFDLIIGNVKQSSTGHETLLIPQKKKHAYTTKAHTKLKALVYNMSPWTPIFTKLPYWAIWGWERPVLKCHSFPCSVWQNGLSAVRSNPNGI